MQRRSARTRLVDAGYVLPGVAGIGMSGGSSGGPWPADFTYRSTHSLPPNG
ncbi:hypothetical protein Sgleb_71170 [Streptomyces glebosus]|uniref:Uncharacterized protein n=1 Tax=Streptomyces glebosus TaxID=249580 RepID=A0A640T7C2_9ACTN|nr:hypothetical protein Sgleb_71170 [Streptomyces glebosus]GHG48132.1 hypothetical protein GCM10010513_04850 [Streptomyces glebosus]